MKTGTRRWWALGAITLAVLAVGLDVTVLSIALPTLAAALHASESDLQWFSAGYALVLAAAMLPAGLLGDRYGRKKVLIISLVLFGIGSVACAGASTATWFLVARLALGLAGAGVIVMAISALTILFSEEERPRAVGVWAAANFIAFPLGPILGGWLLTDFWWGWVFLLNLPVAVIGCIAVVVLVPESRAPVRPGIDWLGVTASSGGLAALTYGLIEAGQNGWADRGALLAMAVGVLVLVAFFLWEGRLSRLPTGQPLVDLALFRSASFTWGVICMTIMTLAMIGIMFTLPQYFQAVVGTSAQGSGLRLLALVGGLLIGALPADRLASRLGRKWTVALGFIILGIGLAVGSQTAVTSRGGYVALWMAVAGVGVGVTMATTASAALSELSADKAGVGSGVLQALKNVGAPFGAAVLGSVLSSVYRGSLELGGVPGAAADAARSSVFAGLAVAEKISSPALDTSVKHAFVSGMDAALWVSVGFAGMGCLCALLFLPNRSLAEAAGHTSREGVGGEPQPGIREEAEQPRPA